ncbi:hypothetical protein [Mycobacterium uberis]|uniref:hypothetical protein n=1 Tax=Mycobacterium uberis TaxID=2162698 RepID=UPI001058565B|nr:hypothetical protein [Mycobacterium uberis]
MFTLVDLFDDTVAADLVAESVATPARVGLRDQWLYTAANRCVAVAAANRTGAVQRCDGATDRQSLAKAAVPGTTFPAR